MLMYQERGTNSRLGWRKRISPALYLGLGWSHSLNIVRRPCILDDDMLSSWRRADGRVYGLESPRSQREYLASFESNLDTQA